MPNRCRRGLAGLVLLLTMALSLAEGASAALCPPGMADASAAVEAASDPSTMDASKPDHAGGHAGHERRGEDPGPCPFGPISSLQGCAAAASLPANAAVELASSPEDASVLFISETEPHLLLGSALFHPPRA